VRGIDYLAIDGAETAQVLSQVAQAIVREDSIVTHDLHNIFPFWKEGGQWFSSIMRIKSYQKILQFIIKLH
jgi:hypothetical protein